MGSVTSGRNLRSVWSIATQPFAEAHFATYPQALVERCIKAGTSEHGCCPVCGAPWARVTEPTPEYAKHLGKSYTTHDDDLAKGMSDHPVGFKSVNAERITTGWRATCECDRPDVTPCVVLDPFNGSSTTSLVANRMGRKAIGVELKLDYCEMAVKRMQQEVLL